MVRAPIAIVGMACRFPGAESVDAYWNAIRRDASAIAPMPASRLDRARYFDPVPGAVGKTYSDLGGLVPDRAFDAAALGLSPEVLARTDVAHLHALEVARAAVEDARLSRAALSGQRCAVLVGHSRGSTLSSDLAFPVGAAGMLEALEHAEPLRGLAPEVVEAVRRRTLAEVERRSPARTAHALGAMPSGLAGLIRGAFNVTGRASVVDAACASSFAALEVALRALELGRIDLALVGAASHSQQLSLVLFAESRALSADGSFPFDRRANGFVSSDGFAFVVLKRLEDARRDGHRVRALIRGIGASSDGRGKALWAPRREGQVLAMERALADAGIEPETVGLLEAHATSTPLGDSTEVAAVDACYRRPTPLPIGSVKGNIGHAREAAGMAGLVKVVAALERAELPPTGNFREPSTEIPWSDVAVEVITAPRPWSARGPRRAAVNAFGIGGLNQHVLLEEAPGDRAQVAVPEALEADRRRHRTARGRLDVAIVGVGARLPGAPSIDAMWTARLEGRSLISPVPEGRWPKAATRAGAFGARGGFLTHFQPDWRRYRVPPRLVERNDPLQFMILDAALDALDDARVDLEAIDRARVGVIVGSMFGSDYANDLALALRAEELTSIVGSELARLDRAPDPAAREAIRGALRRSLPELSEDSSGSFSSSTLASRTAKVLDLMGPAYVVDAASASALVALEAAAELLATSEHAMVLAGGGDRSMRLARHDELARSGVVSSSGAAGPFSAGPFSAGAEGGRLAEGAAMFVLKRLSDAERDGDRIQAVIRGIGSAGSTRARASLTLAMERALASAEISPASVGFVEAHGAAHPALDADELEALQSVFAGPERRAAPLVVGTHKVALGDAQGAAGAFGLLSALTALTRGELPPIDAQPPEDRLRTGAGLVFADARRPVPETPGGARLAGVSASGLAGTSVHVLLERPCVGIEGQPRPRDVVRLRFEEVGALSRLASSTSAVELLLGREVGSGRFAASIAALDEAGLSRALGLLAKTGGDLASEEIRRKQGVFVEPRARTTPDRVALLFSGQGSQYAGMMRAFVAEDAAARGVVAAADAWARARGRSSISEVMLSGAPIPTELFAVQSTVLLADVIAHRVLEASGLRVAFVTGHSFGDYAALVAAGAWTLESALDATGLRCRAIEATATAGGMVSVSAPLAEVRALVEIASSAGHVEPANLNAPDQVVVAGVPKALDRLVEVATARGLETVRLEIPRAFHSALMGEAKVLLERELEAIPIARPTLRYLSSVTGQFEDDPRAIRRALSEQLTRPVDFIGQIRTLLHSGARVFIECGPRGVLASLGKRIAADRDDVAFLTVDDAQRPGRFSLARIEACLDARAIASAPASAPRDDREEAVMNERSEELEPITLCTSIVRQPGFRAFWSENQAAIARFVEDLFAAEGGSVGRLDDAPEAIQLEPLAHLLDEGAGVVPLDEVMRRHVIRAVPAPRPRPVTRFEPRQMLILGRSPTAEALAAAARARGARVSMREDVEGALAELQALGGPPSVDTVAIVLDGRGDVADPSWPSRRRAALEAPFRFLRAWAPHRTSGTVLGLTELGGALGFDNAREGRGEHGALLGLLKAVRREFPGLVVQALDASSSDAPAARAEALLLEVDAGSKRLEVGLCRGQRLELTMMPQAPESSTDAPPLPATWIVTGGARGVTAKLTERLATLYRPRLHLIGRHVLPPEPELRELLALDAAALDAKKSSWLQPASAPGGRSLTPLEWRARCEQLDKSIEIGRNLEALRAAGSVATYHAVDVADRRALAAVLEVVRAEGPIAGLLHGAGVEVAKAFEKKTDALFEATIGAKVDGLVNLLALTEGDPITHIVGFSSVSGRFGGHGQTDYSLANEALARLLSEHRARFSTRRVVVFSFPAFSEVGLAARGSARLFLERAGQTFMTPAEGANHLVRELWAGLPEVEVTLADRIADLDLDHLVPTREQVATLEAGAMRSGANARPVLGEVIAARDGRLVFERVLSAAEPFLDQHRMGATPLLPAVVALEGLTELALQKGVTGVRGLEIRSPLKVAEAGTRVVRFIAEPDGELRLVARVDRADGVVLDPARVHVVAHLAPAPDEREVLATAAHVLAAAGPVLPGADTFAFPYPSALDRSPGSRAIFHGPVFRVLESVTRSDRGGHARLWVPPPSAVFGGACAPRLSAALLDGCLQAAGLLGRLCHDVSALPAGFGRVIQFREPVPGERVELALVFRTVAKELLESDFVLSDARGPFVLVEGYTARGLGDR